MYKKENKSAKNLPKKSAETEVLVLCIDRDNDLGEKTGIKGPVFGREENAEAAKKLLMADPGESDANCMFGAIKELDELRKRGISADIVTLTGDTRVGTRSDQTIGEQLTKAIEEYNPKKIVFVSDGAEDEFLIPVVQSRVPIMSVKRIIVRQSVKLENDYYVIMTFMKDVLSDPRARRILLGIPALVLITYAIYGDIAWRFAIGLTGVYLIIKGFQLEGLVESFARDIKLSLTGGKISFFLYVMAFVFAALGAYQGYQVYLAAPQGVDYIITTLNLLEAGLVYYLISSTSLITGKLLLEGGREKRPFLYLTYYALTFSIYILLENSIAYITLGSSSLRLILSMVAGFMILFVALGTERIAMGRK